MTVIWWTATIKNYQNAEKQGGKEEEMFAGKSAFVLGKILNMIQAVEKEMSKHKRSFDDFLMAIESESFLHDLSKGVATFVPVASVDLPLKSLLRVAEGSPHFYDERTSNIFLYKLKTSEKIRATASFYEIHSLFLYAPEICEIEKAIKKFIHFRVASLEEIFAFKVGHPELAEGALMLTELVAGHFVIKDGLIKPYERQFSKIIVCSNA